MKITDKSTYSNIIFLCLILPLLIYLPLPNNLFIYQHKHKSEIFNSNNNRITSLLTPPNLDNKSLWWIVINISPFCYDEYMYFTKQKQESSKAHPNNVNGLLMVLLWGHYWIQLTSEEGWRVQQLKHQHNNQDKDFSLNIKAYNNNFSFQKLWHKFVQC